MVPSSRESSLLESGAFFEERPHGSLELPHVSAREVRGKHASFTWLIRRWYPGTGSDLHSCDKSGPASNRVPRGNPDLSGPSVRSLLPFRHHRRSPPRLYLGAPRAACSSSPTACSIARRTATWMSSPRLLGRTRARVQPCQATLRAGPVLPSTPLLPLAPLLFTGKNAPFSPIPHDPRHHREDLGRHPLPELLAAAYPLLRGALEA